MEYQKKLHLFNSHIFEMVVKPVLINRSNKFHSSPRDEVHNQNST